MEFWNEGTPFRCFGPHTHRKAPVEAQARFSEESCTLFRRIGITAAQPYYRQARCNSRNLFSVAMRLILVNHYRTKNAFLPSLRPRERRFTTHRSPWGLQNSAVAVPCLQLNTTSTAATCRFIHQAFTLKNCGSNHLFTVLQPPAPAGGEGTCGIFRQLS